MKKITVKFPGPDDMVLHGYMHIPDGDGPFPVLVYNHGSEKDPKDQSDLPNFYNQHGYVFFEPIRHGHGISSSYNGVKYDYIGDLEDKYKANHQGDTEAIEKYIVHLHELYNDDVEKAVHWLKSGAPLKEHKVAIDINRIAMMGVSYGGIQTILSAEKGWGMQACLPYAPAAMSWGDKKLEARLIQAVTAAKVPQFLIQAKNDYSTGPYTTLGSLIKLKSGINRAKLYGTYGDENDHQTAHTLGIRKGGIAIWEFDVLSFLSIAMSNATSD